MGVEKEWLFAIGRMSLVGIVALCLVVCDSYLVVRDSTVCTISQLFNIDALSSFFGLVFLFAFLDVQML